MGFVLMSQTTGDDLIPSQQSPVATSEIREQLEVLQAQRAKARELWLGSHAVPDFQQCAVIMNEEIVEVPTA